MTTGDEGPGCNSLGCLNIATSIDGEKDCTESFPSVSSSALFREYDKNDSDGFVVSDDYISDSDDLKAEKAAKAEKRQLERALKRSLRDQGAGRRWTGHDDEEGGEYNEDNEDEGEDEGGEVEEGEDEGEEHEAGRGRERHMWRGTHSSPTTDSGVERGRGKGDEILRRGTLSPEGEPKAMTKKQRKALKEKEDLQAWPGDNNIINAPPKSIFAPVGFRSLWVPDGRRF